MVLFKYALHLTFISVVGKIYCFLLFPQMTCQLFHPFVERPIFPHIYPKCHLYHTWNSLVWLAISVLHSVPLIPLRLLQHHTSLNVLSLLYILISGKLNPCQLLFPSFLKKLLFLCVILLFALKNQSLPLSPQYRVLELLRLYGKCTSAHFSRGKAQAFIRCTKGSLFQRERWVTCLCDGMPGRSTEDSWSRPSLLHLHRLCSPHPSLTPLSQPLPWSPLCPRSSNPPFCSRTIILQHRPCF